MAFEKEKVKFYSPLNLQQRGFLRQLGGFVQQSMREGGVDAYEGELVPDANELERLAFDAAERVGGRGRVSRDESTERGILKLLSGDPAFDVDPTARRELYEAERAEELRRFNEEVLPMISRHWGGRGGARSGALTGSMADAGIRLGNDLYRRNTELLMHDEDMRRNELARARDRIAEGIRADATARQNDATDFGTLYMAGQGVRAINEGQNQEAYSKWLQEQPYFNPWLGYANAILGTPTNAPYVGTETDWVSAGLNIGGSALSLVGGMGGGGGFGFGG